MKMQRFARQRPGAERRRSVHFKKRHTRRCLGSHLERLEPRWLLASQAGFDYDQVSPAWFEANEGEAVAGVESLAGADAAAAGSGELASDAAGPQWIIRLTEQATRLAGSVRDAEWLLEAPGIDFQVVRGDTLRQPAFHAGDSLATFDCVIANPPFSLEKWGDEVWASDPYGRNFAGMPPRITSSSSFRCRSTSGCATSTTKRLRRP